MVWIKNLVENRKARFNFFLEDKFEAGIVLEGNEVKSAKAGKVSIKEAYCKPKRGEIFIYNMNIAPYERGTYWKKTDPKRVRKLLLNKREIKKIIGKVQERGYTLVPTRVYIKDGLIKVEIALARGKAKADKRQLIRERDIKREMARAMKNYR